MWLTTMANKRPVRNFTTGHMVRPLRGMVLHIQQGHEGGTYSWFNDPKTEVSAHFGNPKKGRLDQFVDTDNEAWAEMGGNRYWISVENEGYPGDYLTDSQIHNLALLMSLLHSTEDVPLQMANSPSGFGLGYHSMGGKPWGNHPKCPGLPIINQRALVLSLASSLTEPGTQTAEIAG